MSIIRTFAQRNRHGFLRIVFGYLAVVLALTACGSTSAPAGGGGPVTMGVLSCFTGTLASLGQAMLQGSQVAQKAINDASSEGN
jgi:ABC-type branched-subunit amino acid transport system substrate-binding protein